MQRARGLDLTGIIHHVVHFIGELFRHTPERQTGERGRSDNVEAFSARREGRLRLSAGHRYAANLRVERSRIPFLRYT